MNANTPEVEIRKIFEKSVRLLATRELQLSKVQKILSKTISRLFFISNSNDEEIDAILKSLQVSNDEQKLEDLDRRLEVFFEMNTPSTGGKENNNNAKFSSYLKSGIEYVDESKYSEHFISKLRTLVNKQLSDKEMSSQLLNVIDEVSVIYHDEYEIELKDNVKKLIDKVVNQTDFSFASNKIKTVDLINEFSNELINYICSNKNNSSISIIGSEILEAEPNYDKVISLLKETVNTLLPLSDDGKINKKNLLEMLQNPKSSNLEYLEIIDEGISLLGSNVVVLQQQNEDFHGFVFKINKQLVEIKSFIEKTQVDSEESVSRSVNLQESVDSSVDAIHEKVHLADNLDSLKQDIAIHLSNIRKNVEDNSVAVKEKEFRSDKDFSSIVAELNRSQSELSEIKVQLKTTKSLLLRDSLTGLYNRTAYEDRVKIEFSRSRRVEKPLCLAMWDIDKFKTINDNYGHDVGDRVLKAFSEIIQKRIRKTDMFARIGGEEFVLLMPDTSIDLAMKLNNELRENFSKCKFHYNDIDFSVTSSVGLSEYCCDDASSEMILKEADSALYLSKKSGRNCCTIYQDKSVDKVAI